MTIACWNERSDEVMKRAFRTASCSLSAADWARLAEGRRGAADEARRHWASHVGGVIHH